MKRVLEALAASFLAHLLILLAIVFLAPRFETQPPQTIEVTIAPQPLVELPRKNQDKQIVRQTLVPDKLKAPDDETLARFLSEQKQRVKKETQAAESGMTANRDSLNPGKGLLKQGSSGRKSQLQAQKQEPPSPDNKSDKADKDGYRTVDVSKELQELNQLNGGGHSTIGEALPTDVKVGSITALNTDRYLFYTFYARVEELTRFRWETRVQQAIEQFDRIRAINMGGRNWNTQVEFLLDRKGFLQKVMVMKESGIKSFDAAAVNAFKEARVFPNPPAEMVQDDGFIHLKYIFTVNYAPPTLVNRN